MDNKIKEELNKIASNYSPSDTIYSNIVNELKGESYMKKSINVKKVAICSAVAAVLLTTGVIASQFAAYSYSHSSRTDLIDHAPTVDEVNAVVDYTPKYAQQLGDYVLQSAQPSIGGLADENHNTISESKEINFEYRNEDGDKEILLFTHVADKNGYKPSPSAIVAGEVNDIKLYYNKTTNKFLPGSDEGIYTPTEEEKKQMEDGTLNIAYGASELTINISENLSWSENGITYSLFTMDNEIGSAELANMAKTIITE